MCCSYTICETIKMASYTCRRGLLFPHPIYLPFRRVVFKNNNIVRIQTNLHNITMYTRMATSYSLNYYSFVVPVCII